MNTNNSNIGSGDSSVEGFNQSAWNKLADNGNQWTLPVSPEEIAKARSGDVNIVLTPTKRVPDSWLQPLKGANVLCLAGGGGQQAPILAAAGANVTTLDNSQRQLEQDQFVAEREGLNIQTVLGIMTDLTAFTNSTFDLIVHPCSNCFSPDVRKVWEEAFRVAKPGAKLISGFNNPVRYIFDYEEYENGNLVVKNRIPYADRDSLNAETIARFEKEGEPLEFGHSLMDQIGGQLDAGFLITGFFEDDWGSRYEGSTDPISAYLDTFIATCATKPS